MNVFSKICKWWFLSDEDSRSTTAHLSPKCNMIEETTTEVMLGSMLHTNDKDSLSDQRVTQMMDLPPITLTEKLTLFPFSIKNMNPQTDEMCKIAILSDPAAFKEIREPSEEIQRFAVGEDGRLIMWIDNPSLEVQKIAVGNDSCAISHIKNPCVEVQKISVAHHPRSIQWIADPCEEVIRKVIRFNHVFVQHFDNPPEDVQLQSVGHHPKTIYLFDNPSEKVVQLHFSCWAKQSYPPRPTEDYVSPLEADINVKLKEFPQLIISIKNPTEQQIKIAMDGDAAFVLTSGIDVPGYLIEEFIQRDGDNIQYITQPSEHLQLLAVSENSFVIEHLNNPSIDIQMVAVANNLGALEYIKNPNEDVIEYAVSRYGQAITWVENPSDRLKLMAIANDSYILDRIKNPTREMIILAVHKAGCTISMVDSENDEELQLLAIQNTPNALMAIPYPTERAISIHKMLWEV